MRRVARLAVLGALGSASSVTAQDTPPRRVACDGRVVSDIVIRTQGPSFGGVFERSNFLSALVSGAHVTTSPDLVRRFLLLEQGKPCTSTLRADSERILRGQPFLAGASVTTYDDGRGGRARGGRDHRRNLTRRERIRVAGIAVRDWGASGELEHQRDGDLRRWRVAGRRFLPRRVARDRDRLPAPSAVPFSSAAEVERRPIGGDWSTELRHPFFTDVQRIAWRAAIGSSLDCLPVHAPRRPRPVSLADALVCRCRVRIPRRRARAD